MIGFCGCGGITTSCADTDNRDLFRVDIVAFLKIVDHTVHVAHALGRVFEEAWLAAALALVGCVVANCHISMLREVPGVESCSLLLDTTAGMNDNKRGEFGRGGCCGFEEESSQLNRAFRY